MRAVEAARRHRLLPEAWLYGFTDVYRRSQVRPAFLNGDFRLRGWPSFFPYTFLVKTPLSAFAVLALSLAAVDWRGRRAGGENRGRGWARLRGAAPLWALFGVYWAAALASHLNIGHRHLMPVYAPLFVLCGIAARWFEAGRGRRCAARPPWRSGRGLALRAHGPSRRETARSFPNYLAYFNRIVRAAERLPAPCRQLA